MAVGQASADATSFELVAARGLETYGICSNPFLEYAFKTVEFRIKVTLDAEGTWSYDEETVLMIRGRDERHARRQAEGQPADSSEEFDHAHDTTS